MSAGNVEDFSAQPAGTRFVASHRLKPHGYDRLCPIVQVQVDLHANNGDPILVAQYGESVLFEESLLADAPGFLVLHFAGIEPDPIVESAASALFHSLRSLLETCGTDVPVHYERIRTALEVRMYMEAHRWLYSHVILIGHGGPDGIGFIDEPAPLAKSEFARLLGCHLDCREMQVISLCCHTGCEDMAEELSRDPSVREVIAPDGGFDVRWSTVFVLAYVLKVFDEGYLPEEAVRELSFGQPLCVWRAGNRVACDTLSSGPSSPDA